MDNGFINKHLTHKKLVEKLKNYNGDNLDEFTKQISDDIFEKDDINLAINGIKKNDLFNIVKNKINGFWNNYLKAINFIKKMR